MKKLLVVTSLAFAGLVLAEQLRLYITNPEGLKRYYKECFQTGQDEGLKGVRNISEIYNRNLE